MSVDLKYLAEQKTWIVMTLLIDPVKYQPENLGTHERGPKFKTQSEAEKWIIDNGKVPFLFEL